MLILQTGVPGSGKTSSIIALLMQDESYTHYTDSEGVKRERPLFTNGIPDLKIEHNELTDEQIKEQPFQDFLPYGSLVVIDEAQRLFPTRSAAAKVPPYIEALATHRHHGLDIVFITQHPSFLDSFVRRLVQRHMHISIKPVGRKLYEWNECVDQPESSQNIARAIEVNFKLPKEAFGMYKSAEIHTKPQENKSLCRIRTQKEQKRQTRCKNDSRILRREEPQTQNVEAQKPNGKGATKHHTLHSKTEATKSIRNSQKANRIRQHQRLDRRNHRLSRQENKRSRRPSENVHQPKSGTQTKNKQPHHNTRRRHTDGLNHHGRSIG